MWTLGLFEHPTNPLAEDSGFAGWVVGFRQERSDELDKLPEMLADHDALASRYNLKAAQVGKPERGPRGLGGPTLRPRGGPVN